jgi:glycerol-3-phosphate dehydrogenase
MPRNEVPRHDTTRPDDLVGGSRTGISALSPQARQLALDSLASGDELDVLVIGGGVTGAGAALDAVTRGLSTGLVELRDWASGTSSRSSKLVHGGLRYLEMLDFALVREALHERGLLLQRLAPHLVKLPARPRQHGPGQSADPGRRGGRLRRSEASADRRVGIDVQAVPRRGGRRLRPAGAGELHRHRPAGRADGYAGLWNARKRLADTSGLTVDRVEHLLNRYGSLTEDLLDMIAADPSLAETLPGSGGYLKAEVVYAATHEGARHLEDVLARRTRISIETRDRGAEAAPVACELMGDRLGWDADRRVEEVENYLARVKAELKSQQQTEDQDADAARRAAPDIVPVA